MMLFQFLNARSAPLLLKGRAGFFRLLFLLAVIAFAFILPHEGITQENYNSRLVQILEGYQELIKKPEVANTGKDQPREDWLVIRQAIEKGHLRFTISPSETSIIRGLSFRAVPSSNTTHVIFSKPFIDAWSKRPALAYSLLAQRLHETAFFFRNPNLWQKVRKNALEQTFIVLDDYSLMAHLILYRLSPMGFNTGEYEKFILDSFQQDNLAGAMQFMERITIQIAAALSALSMEYEETLDDKHIRSEVLKLGRALLERRVNMPAASQDISIYSHAVGIHSWLELTPHIMARFHNRERPENPLRFDAIIELETEYSSLRSQLEAQRTRDMPLMNHIYEKTLEGFERL